MIQLSYQPSLDPFHAMFRILRAIPVYRANLEISVDHARILDFYMVFPFRIEYIRLRPEHRKYKRLAQAYAHSKPYGEQPEDSALFERMNAMQTAAMETLASNEYLDAARLRASWLRPNDLAPPPALQARLDELNSQQSDLIEFLSVLASEYSVAGVNGLKHRTSLMEHRYDVV